MRPKPLERLDPRDGQAFGEVLALETTALAVDRPYAPPPTRPGPGGPAVWLGRRAGGAVAVQGRSRPAARGRAGPRLPAPGTICTWPSMACWCTRSTGGRGSSAGSATSDGCRARRAGSDVPGEQAAGEDAKRDTTQQQVQDAADELIRSGVDRGLQIAAYLHGEPVVEVAAGQDAAGRPIAPDTPVPALSTGKGAAATVVHVLVEQGVLSYDTRIADLWPEFGVHGKHAATVRHALTHSVGLAALPAGTTPETMCDWDAMCGQLAAAEPAWEPGTRTGYHAQTWGYLIGELVRRATGEPISNVLRERVAGPLGVADELFFGVPEPQHSRVARVEETPEYAQMLANSGTPVPPTAAYSNRADVLAADIPSGGVMSARAVARMYAALLDEVDGVRLVSAALLRELSAIAYTGPDVVMDMPTVLALGYGVGRPGRHEQPAPTVFGMQGAGGSAACADTATGTAGGTTTRLHGGATTPALEVIGALVADQLR